MENILDDLFVFEMANNHQGQVQHGLEIIETMARIKDKYDIKAAVKFQYRELDSFIHDDFKNRMDVKHIPRFLSTRLTYDEFDVMVSRVKELGMISMVTPFDEVSVDRCIEQGIDILKIASCSADDWPLLDRVAKVNKPVIISTGGLGIHEIDDLVSYFTHKKTTFAIMHCVALYPCGNDNTNMNFLDKLKKRYPGIPIGYSGHEDPGNTDIVKIAVGKKVNILERHVGVETEKIKLNAYSMNPIQVEEWIKAALLAEEICGNDVKSVSEEEIESLLSLKRGVYTRRRITKGTEITKDDVYFAMPCTENQTTSGEFGRYRSRIVATKSYEANDPIYEHDEQDNISYIRQLIHDAKGMICEGGIQIPQDRRIELSHHYGLDRFREYGALFINMINREYCKKLIVVFPGQYHPFHHHKIKEETFYLLWGDLTVEMNDNLFQLSPGETLLVGRGVSHAFTSKNGAIFEEISTTHVKNDSYYDDLKIANLDPIQRKTMIDNW